MIDKVEVDMVIEKWVEESRECCGLCRMNIEERRNLTLAFNLNYRYESDHLGTRLLAVGMTHKEIDTLRATLTNLGT